MCITGAIAFVADSRILEQLDLRDNDIWMARLTWEHPQNQAFATVESELMKPTVLTLFDVNADLKISPDASCFGLSAALLQNNDSCWQSVTFTSQVMSDNECRYTQVEKGAK